jgi:hypothetical protein
VPETAETMAILVRLHAAIDRADVATGEGALVPLFAFLPLGREIGFVDMCSLHLMGQARGRALSRSRWTPDLWSALHARAGKGLSGHINPKSPVRMVDEFIRCPVT